MSIEIMSIEKQKQLSKEFVREWLIDHNFMGKEGQTVPEMTEEWIDTISNRYIELYEILIGKPFEPKEWNSQKEFEIISAALSKAISGTTCCSISPRNGRSAIISSARTC